MKFIQNFTSCVNCGASRPPPLLTPAAHVTRDTCREARDTRTCAAPLSVCVAGHDGERAQRDGRQRRQAGRGQDLRRAALLHLQDAQGLVL